jgi:aryl-phospho-beta-D-glucosidase BglC (GH1 family)
MIWLVWFFLLELSVAQSQSPHPHANESDRQHIKCMNFYGMETEQEYLVCDWTHNSDWFMDNLINNLQINMIRLPFSYELIKYHSYDKLRAMIDLCHNHGVRVLLDWHRTWHSHQGPSPEEGISRTEFIQAWIDLLYQFPDVWGVGIFNEIQFDDKDCAYTNALHHEVITAIESVFPNRFMYVAGCPGWGGNCSCIELSDMPTWNRTLIAVHKYIFSGNSVRSDWEISIPHRISPDHWFVSEFGWKQKDQREREWAVGFLDYLSERGIYNTCAWTIAHSGDTDGWWFDDCETFDWDKASILTSFYEKSKIDRPRHLLRSRDIPP